MPTSSSDLLTPDPELDDPLVVSLDRFHGPLDLLLHLIRRQDIDIFDIPIAKITEQFLDAIRGFGRTELERAGEFLEMAATLIRIKAQLLFPRRRDEEEEDPRADLVRRLLEYEHFREAARLLESAERDRSRYLRKGFVPPRPAPPLSDAPLETEWSEVWSALHQLIQRLQEPEPGVRIAGRLVRLEEKIEHIMGIFRRSSRVEFTAIVSPWGTRMHAVMSLLACLELAKRSTLRLRQASPFSPLWIYKRRGDGDAG